MPLYEFSDKTTGESVGELFLSFDGLEDFLEMNPNLCVKPGKLRYFTDKSDDAFPSYPDMNTHTKSKEERHASFKPADPASWNDTKDPTENYTKYKVTDRRKNKISHFEEDIKKYGKIVSAPRMLGEGSQTDFHVDKVDSSDPITMEEEMQQLEQQEKENASLRQKRYEYERGMRGTTSENAIELTDSQSLNPWEKGYAKQNKDHYKDLNK